MLKIRSKRALPFDPVGRKEGIVEIIIESYSRHTINKTFTLHLVDRMITKIPGIGFEEIPATTDDNGFIEPATTRTYQTMVDHITENRRSKTYTDDEMIDLAITLGVESNSIGEIIDNLDELFRRGLLAITQKECLDGKGIYMSEVNDWELAPL